MAEDNKNRYHAMLRTAHRLDALRRCTRSSAGAGASPTHVRAAGPLRPRWAEVGAARAARPRCPALVDRHSLPCLSQGLVLAYRNNCSMVLLYLTVNFQ